MLGPVLLHREPKFKDYSMFLSMIKLALFGTTTKDNLKKTEQKITFGWDNEQSLVKSISSVFPNSKLRLCSLHLKKNITRKLIVFLRSLFCKKKNLGLWC